MTATHSLPPLKISSDILRKFLLMYTTEVLFYEHQNYMNNYMYNVMVIPWVLSWDPHLATSKYQKQYICYFPI